MTLKKQCVLLKKLYFRHITMCLYLNQRFISKPSAVIIFCLRKIAILSVEVSYRYLHASYCFLKEIDGEDYGKF